MVGAILLIKNGRSHITNKNIIENELLPTYICACVCACIICFCT